MKMTFYDSRHNELRVVEGSWQCLKQSTLVCLADVGNGLIEGVRKTAISLFLSVPRVRKEVKYILNDLNRQGL